MIVTTIIFSKDRPAQLDLLLRSVERNGGGQFAPYVVWDSSSSEFFDGYEIVRTEHRGASGFHSLNPFETDTRFYLGGAHEFVCFMCDDGILYRPLPLDPTLPLQDDNSYLCVSLRLGFNTVVSYPADLRHPVAAFRPPGKLFGRWNWTAGAWERDGDFYYPGSLDGHIFRTADVQRMLAGKTLPHPTALECALMDGCYEIAAERPLMACYPHSVYVGNPINRVSDWSGVRFGATYPVTAEECNRRFLAGERIDLDALDFSGVNGAHTEIEFKWR